MIMWAAFSNPSGRGKDFTMANSVAWTRKESKRKVAEVFSGDLKRIPYYIRFAKIEIKEVTK